MYNEACSFQSSCLFRQPAQKPSHIRRPRPIFPPAVAISGEFTGVRSELFANEPAGGERRSRRIAAAREREATGRAGRLETTPNPVRPRPPLETVTDSTAAAEEDRVTPVCLVQFRCIGRGSTSIVAFHQTRVTK